MGKVWTAALLACAAGAALTACGSPQSPSAAEPTGGGLTPGVAAPPATTSDTTSATPPSPAATGITTGAATPAGPQECRADVLALSVGSTEGAAGTVYRDVVFTNTGQSPCVLQGFPGVSYVAGDDGHQVGPAAYREGTKGAPVTVQPGGTAAAPVGFVNVGNYDPAVCQPTQVRGLRVYPPQETASLFIDLPGTGCAGNPPGNQLVVKTITG